MIKSVASQVSLFVGILAMSLFSCTSVNGKDSSDFIELFKHELQNRALAVVAVANAAEDRKGKPDGEFWHLYSQLEQINQKKFIPYAEKYQLAYTMNMSTKIKLTLSELYGSIYPKHHLSLLVEATAKYVDKLKELKKLSPADDKEFFRYVVLQEKAQAESLKLLEADTGLAIEKMRAFIATLK